MENKADFLNEGVLLEQLVSDYYEQSSRGCSFALVDLVAGKNRRRAEEISQLAGIGDALDVTTLFASVDLICIESKSKDEANQKLYDAFMKGTDDGKKTGSITVDNKIEKAAILAKIALDKNWEIRERRSI